MQSKKEFLDDIAVSLGGYIAEKMVFGDLTTGPSNDLQVLTSLARSMVTRFGMSEKMGPVAIEGDGGQILLGRGAEDRSYSEKVSSEIDAEVSRIIDEAYKKGEEILTTHRKALDHIARELMEVETIERDEFEKLLITNGITPKKKLDIEHQV
jgi:cell division protease FtsH